MNLSYPKVRIVEDDDVVRLKPEQLLFVADPFYNLFSAGERVDGFLANKSFFLSKDFDWIIVKDDQKQLCLVPLKKEKDEKA